MHDLFWKRDEAIRNYEKLCENRDKRNEELAKKKILRESMLILMHNNALDKTFQRKFKHRWDGPYVIHKMFANGTYCYGQGS